MDLIKSPGSDDGTPTSTNANKYNCQICGFSASRLNVIILHNKTHSDTSGTPATPPKVAKPIPKTSPSVTSSSLVSVKSLLTPIIPPKGKPGRPKGSGKKKPVIAATSAVDTPSTPKPRGRGRPPRAKKVEEPDVKPAIVKPTKAPSPVKKSRLTKKEKEELAKEEARKKEERDKILGDWDDEEEEEERKVVPEKTRMRDLMEPFVDSSEEEEEEGFMGDDNVHGNSYEGEEEQDKKDREIEEARLKKEKDERDKIEAIKSKSDDQIDESKKNGDHNGSTDVSGDTSLSTTVLKGDDELLAMDIGKVLEETAVPDVPSVDVEKVKKRKSVSFGATKEFANTKIALVQPESNLDDPMMIDDEFDEFVSSADISMPSPPKVYQAKKILKRGVETNPVSISSVAQSSELVVSKPDVVAGAPPTNGASANNGGLQGTTKVEVDQSKVDSGIEAEESVPLPEPNNTEDPPKSQESSSNAPEPEKSVSESHEEAASHPVPDTSAEEQKVDESPQVDTTTDLPTVSEPSEEKQTPTKPDSNSQQDSGPLSNGTSVESQSESLVAVSLSNETNTVSAVQMVMTTSDIISENGPADTTYVSQIPSPSVMATASALNVMTTVGGETASVVTSGEDTYLILVDDGSGAVDSLNSQTLYIDPSQLENGNMVLMTNEGVPVSAQGVSVASSNSNNHPHEILAALNTQQLQLQHQQQQQQPPQQPPKTPVLGSGVKLGLVETTPSPTARPVMSPAEIPSGSVALSNNTPVISEQQQQQQQQQQVLLAGTVTQDQVIP
ncbi:hypothetical protein TCAL_16950 [Tigriopus californicus]|uniref:C2H2-type domain-containing protein n=2 Tax=Tigriopus californicus TaxID=6832 RepID=A0A553NNI2_TIGCA|nr:hypothetical protein TCAL_16950 [Tigriopus californicus]